jgi:stage V sporulation protein R
MSDDLIAKLVKADNHIQKIVQEFGLDCFPQEFDVIPANKMLEIMSYRLPVNYSHWSFGRDYERERTQYEYTGGIPYEVVLNANPSRAFLMRTNPYPIQVLVMAHVYGHNDFMKNNIHFRNTRRDMLTSASEAANRFRRYEEEYGVEEVERLIDAAHSLQWHIDEDLFPSDGSATGDKVKKSDTSEASSALGRKKSGSAFSDVLEWEKNLTVKTHEERREEGRNQKRRIPDEPTSDLLSVIMRHSPRGFDEWELDILQTIHEQALYFNPQRKTKTMNEGWASFWHMRIMKRLFQDGYLTAEEHGFYNLYNSRVLASNPFGLNPYLLGIKTFQDIEDRWDKGLFGSEWERRVDPDKWNIDLHSNQGMEKIFAVRRTHMDWFFLDEFLNHRICDKAELYLYGSRLREGNEEVVVEETEWKTIKRLLVRSLAHSGIPLIKAVDGDYGGRRELALKHHYEGLPLDEDYARNTLKHVFFLWRNVVHLETVEADANKEVRVEWSYDGKGFSKVILGDVQNDGN